MSITGENRVSANIRRRRSAFFLAALFFAMFFFPETSFAQSEGDETEIIEVTPLSKTTVKRKVYDSKKVTLYLNPELSFSGMFAKYKKLGWFNFWDYGGGIGAIYKESWYFRLHLHFLFEYHALKEKSTKRITCHPVWFLQPAAYAMYRVAHFKKYHYFFPMDFFLGVKLGANHFIAEKSILNLDDETSVLWGATALWRFYFHKRIGIAFHVEVSTIDYFKNPFIHYGGFLFWDFEVIGKR